MRTLSLVVLVESVALLVLGIAWLVDGDSVAPIAPDLGNGASDALADGATDPRHGAVSGTRTAVVSASRPGERYVGVSGVVGDGAVLVQGRVTRADGSDAPAEVSLFFRRGPEYRTASVAGDRYAATALSPGVWSLRVTAAGCAVYDVEHELGTAPVQTIDVELQPAHLVRVFVDSTDGAPLTTKWTQMSFPGGGMSINVIATDEALPGHLPETESSSVGDLGRGRFVAAQGVVRSSEPTAPDGELWLDQPPPANAALLLRHLVIAQQPIAPGQTELRFVVDPDVLQGWLPTVTLRLLDGTSGEPIVEGVRVSLATAQGGGSQGTPDAEGRVTIEHAMPGLASFQISGGSGRESLWDLVRVPAGGTLDLGDIVLHPAIAVPGRLVDEAGAPVATGKVQWTNLATMDFPRELIDRRSSSVDGDGAFQLRLGPHRYVLIASAAGGLSGYTVVDAGRPGVEPVEIILRATCRIDVRAAAGFEAFVVTVRTEDGTPVAARRIDPRWPAQVLGVPPGNYTLEVHGAGDRLVKRMPVTARVGETVAVRIP